VPVRRNDNFGSTYRIFEMDLDVRSRLGASPWYIRRAASSHNMQLPDERLKVLVAGAGSRLDAAARAPEAREMTPV